MAILPPSQGPFYNLLTSYFGNYQEDVRQVIWASFLEEKALQNNPSDSDVEKLTQFAQYLYTYYDNLLLPDAKVSERTKIVFSIFDALIEMMKVATTTQITSQRARVFLTKKQEMYRQMMAKTVLYQGAYGAMDDGKFTKTSPSSDPTKFNLGYGDLTLEDISTHLVRQANQNYITNLKDPSKPNNSVEFKLSRPVEKMGLGALFYSPLPYEVYFNFSVKKIGNNSYQMEVTLKKEGGMKISMPTEFFGTPKLEKVYETVASTARSGTNDTAIKMMNAAFYDVYNQFKGKHYEVPMKTPTDAIGNPTNLQLSWPEDINYVYSGGGDDKKKDDYRNKYAKQAGLRGESNKREQTAIDATKSRIDILKDFSDQQGQLVDASSDGKSQASNLFQSIIRQLQNMLNSIFKS